MGKVITVDPRDVRPSQDFLKKDTFKFIKQNFESGDLKKLPPMPAVRKHPNDDFLVAIDGHNLLAFYASISKKCKVYLVENKDDFLEGNSKSIKDRNKNIRNKFDSVISVSDYLMKNSFTSINSLL